LRSANFSNDVADLGPKESHAAIAAAATDPAPNVKKWRRFID
jgi:hypothetical protein